MRSAREEIYVPRDGPKGGRWIKSTSADKMMTADEYVKFLEAIRTDKSPYAQDSYVLFWLMGNLGLRIGEVCILKNKAFRMLDAQQCLIVESLKKKFFKWVDDKNAPDGLRRKVRVELEIPELRTVERELYLNSKEAGYLRSVRDAYRVTQDHPDRAIFRFMSTRKAMYLFDYYRRKANLRPQLTSHSLRHLCKYTIFEIDPQNMWVRMLAMIRLRHAPSSSSDLYGQMPPSQQIELLEKKRVFF